jgi:hypothetical protein
MLDFAAFPGGLGNLRLSKTRATARRRSRSIVHGVRARLTHACARNFCAPLDFLRKIEEKILRRRDFLVSDRARLTHQPRNR